MIDIKLPTATQMQPVFGGSGLGHGGNVIPVTALPRLQTSSQPYYTMLPTQ